MKELKIIPSYNCPHKCKFCYNLSKNKQDILDLDKLKEFLSKNHLHFDRVVIDGGEPYTLDSTYFNKLMEIVLSYDNYYIAIKTYPVSLNNYIDNDSVHYELSYDFLARPYAQEAWKNIVRFPKPFDLKTTLSPFIFKYHPNKLLQMISVAENMKSIEFLPYYSCDTSSYNIKQKYYNQFFEIIFKSKLNIKFKIQNIENIKNKDYAKPETYIISPENGFNKSIQAFDDKGRIFNKEVEDFSYGEEFDCPEYYNLYNDTLKDYAKTYGIID